LIADPTNSNDKEDYQMKPYYLLALVACLFLVFASGCLPPKSPVYGLVYMDVKGPEQATPNLLGKKMGKGCCESVLGVYARGDCSIETAAREANITRITHVDHYSETILLVYSKYTILVYGN